MKNCPQCGSSTRIYDEEFLDKQWQRAGHSLGAIHPALGVAGSVGNIVYKGLKRTDCLKKECVSCGHRFY